MQIPDLSYSSLKTTEWVDVVTFDVYEKPALDSVEQWYSVILLY